VNLKAETVEELKARRKNLHMGMCELLREDLAYKADEKLSRSSVAGDVGRRIKERILKDFDDQTREHESIKDEVFNRDEMYKELSNEVIDGKAYALEKMNHYLQMATGGMPVGQHIETTILNTALKDFAGMIELRTEFPWDDVTENKKTEIDLSEWDAGTIPPRARELVAGALGCNAVIRAVRIKGVRLELSGGWATEELDWQNKAAVNKAAVPETVALVLRSCLRLKFLNLRCSQARWERIC
jgi:hypothetical protein